jgi:hypothetical protein
MDRADRNTWLSAGIARGSTVLEIGTLDRPILRRPRVNVRYAANASREELQRKYAGHGSVDPNAIPEIDYVISDAGLLAAVGEQRFDHAVASHVIEQVPNPIGWLKDMHDLLRDRGVLALAIPDHRRCFDALRRPSTAAEMVEAALLGHSRPSPSRIFDALSNEVTSDNRTSWDHEARPEQLRLRRTPANALQIVRQVQATGERLDVHCWVFTPESFCNLMRTLAATDLHRLMLLELRRTTTDEFLVRLTRRDDATVYERVASFPARGERYATLPQDFDALAYGRLNPDVVVAGVDPYDHYVQYGRSEGRAWR